MKFYITDISCYIFKEHEHLYLNKENFFLLKCCDSFYASVFQGQQLKSVEDEVYNQLVEQIKLHSEVVISDVVKAATALRTDLQNLNNFSQYALMVHTLGHTQLFLFLF